MVTRQQRGRSRHRQAGNYRHRFTCEQPTNTNTAGTVTQSWTEHSKFWGSLWPLQGREQMVAAQMEAQTTHIVRTWYRSDVSFDATMRLKLGTRTFNIELVRDIEEDRKEFEFRVVEVTV